MDKQTPGQLFLSIFLRAAVAVLGIVICVFGIYFLTKYVKNGNKKDAKPVATVDDNVLTEVGTHDDLLMNTSESTESASDTDVQDSTEQKNETPKDKNILVLNSTEQSGLAGGWCVTLNEKGFDNTTASDFSTPLQRTKIVAQKNGDGKEFMDWFKSPIYEVGTVTEGAPFDTSAYDIVIIIGTNDATESSPSDSDDSDNDSNDDEDNSDDGNEDNSDNGDYSDESNESNDEE